jgi:hypothetical protein
LFLRKKKVVVAAVISPFMVIVLITENGCHQYLWGYGG